MFTCFTWSPSPPPDHTILLCEACSSDEKPQNQFNKYTLNCIYGGRGGGRVVRRCCVNFQCRGVLLIWIIVGQGPIALAIGAGGECLDIFSLVYLFFFFFLPLWETARFRLKYCLKGPLNPKQPTNQPNMEGDQCSKNFEVRKATTKIHDCIAFRGTRISDF